MTVFDAMPIETASMNVDGKRLIVFWLPVVLIAIAVFDNHARYEYAETAIGMVREYVDEVEASASTSRSKQLTFLSFGALGAMLLLRKNQIADTRSTAHWSIMVPSAALLTYMFGSMLWSDEPTTTVKRVILAACIAVGSWGLGKAWTLADFCKAIILLSSVFVLVGIAAEMYYGTFMSLGESDYRFSGVLHPARTAFGCALMALACFTLYRQENRSFYLILAIVAIGLTILTKARTGTGALLIASAWFWWRQFSMKRVLAAGWIGLVAFSLALIYWGTAGTDLNIDAISRMGREQELADPSTFTGRLPIWSECMKLFSDRPLLGFGYGAFWNSGRIAYFEKQTGWSFTHSHSAYIESLINLGVIGFAIGLTAIAATFDRCRRFVGANVLAGSLVASILIFGIVSGVAESAFVDDGYELIIGVAAMSYIAHRRLESEADNE